MVNIALLTKYNSYVGREYASKLIKNDINFIFITFGNQDKAKDEGEEIRCGGLWQPTLIGKLRKQTNFVNFNDINSEEFKTYIKEKEINLGIQGDIGEIINEESLLQNSTTSSGPNGLRTFRCDFFSLPFMA